MRLLILGFLLHSEAVFGETVRFREKTNFFNTRILFQDVDPFIMLRIKTFVMYTDGSASGGRTLSFDF